MNCEDTLALIGKSFSGTTRAERSAGLVHLRGCESCQKLVNEKINAIPHEKLAAVAFAAAKVFARDKADPEWK